MFSKSAALYDAIYLNTGKDYAAEAERVHAFVNQYKQACGDHLLDVACGTGIHIISLSQHYQVEGLDLDEKMLEIARKKCPQLLFHQGDMLDFSLDHHFDVITCLFSSIGYVKTLPRLHQAIANMAGHLTPGGVLVVEPWISPEKWTSGKFYATFVDQPDLKIARMNFSENKDRLSFFTFHYLVASSQGIQHFTELHELGLFTEAEYLESFRTAGLDAFQDAEGLDGRGLYIGRKRIL